MWGSLLHHIRFVSKILSKKSWLIDLDIRSLIFFSNRIETGFLHLYFNNINIFNKKLYTWFSSIKYIFFTQEKFSWIKTILYCPYSYPYFLDSMLISFLDSMLISFPRIDYQLKILDQKLREGFMSTLMKINHSSLKGLFFRPKC